MFIVNFYRPQTLLRRAACKVFGQTFIHCNFQLEDDPRYLYDVGHARTCQYEAEEHHEKRPPHLSIHWNQQFPPNLGERLTRFLNERMDKSGTLGYLVGMSDQPVNCASSVGRVLGHPFLFVGTPDELLSRMIHETYAANLRLPPDSASLARLVGNLGKSSPAPIGYENYSRVRLTRSSVSRGHVAGITEIAVHLQHSGA